MSKLALTVVVFLVVLLLGNLTNTSAAQTTAFTPNNLVVVRVGNGATSLTNSATAVFLDEYTINGALVQSVALPINPSGNNRIFTLSGTGTTEGAVALSTDSKYLTFGGYDAGVGIGGVASISASTYNRVVARVDSNGAIDTSSAFSDVASGDSVRSAVTDNGANLWITGGAGGIRYAPFGAVGGSTQLNNSATNIRILKIFGNQLYYSTGALSPARGIHQIGAGLPTNAGQNTTLLATPSGISPSPYDFVLLDLNSAVPGIDTLYFGDDRTVPGSGGIHKWIFNGTEWTQAAIFNNGLTAGVRGLTARQTGATVILYATTAATTSQLVKLVDDGTPNPSASLLATALPNTAFRGVTFTPLSSINVNCANPFKVTATIDDGKASSCGTLSYALAQPVTGLPYTVTFALSEGTRLNFTSKLTATLQPGVIIDGGTCANGLILSGAAQEFNLLGNNQLRNLKIQSSGEAKLTVHSSGNKLECFALDKGL